MCVGAMFDYQVSLGMCVCVCVTVWPHVALMSPSGDSPVGLPIDY